MGETQCAIKKNYLFYYLYQKRIIEYHFCINNYINIFMEANFIKNAYNTFLGL